MAVSHGSKMDPQETTVETVPLESREDGMEQELFLMEEDGKMAGVLWS